VKYINDIVSGRFIYLLYKQQCMNTTPVVNLKKDVLKYVFLFSDNNTECYTKKRLGQVRNDCNFIIIN